MNNNLDFLRSFYVNQDLFNSFEEDIRAAYNDPGRVGTLNGVQVRPLPHTDIKRWANEMAHHCNLSSRYGFLAINAIFIAALASMILATPIAVIVAGSIGLVVFTASVIKMHREYTNFRSLQDRYTQQRALEAQTYLAIGPIELIRQKHGLYIQNNTPVPHFSNFSEEISFVNPNTFIDLNILIWTSFHNPFEIFQRCFVFQQADFDAVKENSNNVDDHAMGAAAQEFKNTVINWYKGDDILTPIAQDYCNLVTNMPPTDDRLNIPAVKACIRKHFPDWYVAPDTPPEMNSDSESDKEEVI